MKKFSMERCAVKEKDEADYVRMKKINVEKGTFCLPKKHVGTIKRHIEIFLFTYEPTGLCSKLARQCFELRKKEVMEKLVQKQARLKISGTEHLDVLQSAPWDTNGKE